MSKRTYALVLVAMVAAMNLAGLTTLAQAQPPDAVEQFRRGERASQQQPTIADDTRRPPTEAQVGESWRHPANVRVRPPEPSGQPDWLVPAIGVLAAILALAAGLVVMAAKRTGRRMRAGQAA